MQIGGPAEGYMDAPSLNGMGGGSGSKGGGNFISNLLNLLGIEKTVAQGGDSGASKDAAKSKGSGAGTPAAATAAIPQDKTAMQNGAMYESHGAAAASGFLTGLGHGLAKGSTVQAPIVPPVLAATPSATQPTNPFLGQISPIQVIDPNTVWARP